MPRRSATPAAPRRPPPEHPDDPQITPTMTQRLKPLLLSLAAAGVFAALLAISVTSTVRAADEKKPAASKAALTVTVTQLQPASLPTLLAANGSIAAWQGGIVGTEANGLRLADVKV